MVSEAIIPTNRGYICIEKWSQIFVSGIKLCTVRRIFIELWVQHIRTRQVREQRRLRPRLPNAASRNLTTITKEKRALGAQGV